MDVNWTQVLVYGIPAMIAALGSAAATIIAALNRRDLRTSNGHTVGQMVEETHAATVEPAETREGQ